MNKMNKMNHFVPHLYTEKRQNEDKMTKCHLVPPSSIARLLGEDISDNLISEIDLG